MLSASVFAEEENMVTGTVGRMTWTLNKETYTLEINCAGTMPTFSSYSEVPWKSFSDYIHRAVILDGATNVSDYAFCYCADLSEITIPDSVTTIGRNSFAHTALTSICISDSVTTIGLGAFIQCLSLSSVTLGNNVRNIGEYAFSGCSALSNISIPDSVTQLQTGVFRECYNLASVSIGSGVTGIRDVAFAYCTSLVSIELPINVISVYHSTYKGSFEGCSSMESIYFYNPSCSITSGSIPANATIYGYSGSTAETYADNNGLLFMEIDGHEHHYSVTRTVAPTCTEDGYNELFCPCGERDTEILPATGHTPVEVPAKAANCTEGGYKEWSYCSVCGEVLTEKVETEPTGHTPVTTGAYPASCGKEGFTGVTYCDVCTTVLNAGEAIEATGEHTPAQAQESVISAPTCGSNGIKLITVKCSVCSETLSETTASIPATGEHTEGAAEESVISAPTCGSNGIKLLTVKCSVCSETLSETTASIPATGEHTEGAAEEITVRAATCTTAGEKVIRVKCAVCGQTLSEHTEGVSAPGHSYTSSDISPTCTSQGYTVYTCERGDSEYISDYVRPLGHSDQNGDGKCDRCGETLSTPSAPATDPSNSGENNGGGSNSGSNDIRVNNAFEFLIHFFRMLLDFFKGMFR